MKITSLLQFSVSCQSRPTDPVGMIGYGLIAPVAFLLIASLFTGPRINVEEINASERMPAQSAHKTT
ncbi:MAG TPA: hypothetical protein VHO48_01680 [Anaerolineaceae bacterium]|nr:hypothetical protein [Anaerolineaceae bacterium]